MKKLSKYYFKYLLEGIPYYYEFTCYAESEKEAEARFILNVDGVLVDSYIAHVEPV